MKSINKITVLNFFSIVIVQGATFVSAPIFSRLMGASNYGIYSVVNAWGAFVASFFGLQVASTIGVAKTHYTIEKQIKYQSSILTLQLLSFTFISSLCLLFSDGISRVTGLSNVLIWLIVIQGFSSSVIEFANAKFIVEFDAWKNLILSSLSTIGGIVLSYILFSYFPQANNYYARILGIVIVNTILAMIFVIFLYAKSRLVFNKEYWCFCLSLSLPMIFHSLSGVILNQGDRVIIQKYMDNANTGIYSLSFSFASITSVIYLALSNSFLPFYLDFLKREKRGDILHHAKNLIELYTVLSTGFVMLTPEVFKLFADKSYWEGIQYIPFFCIGNFFIFLYGFSINYESFMKKTGMIAMATITAGIINTFLNLLLVKKFGVIGVVFATLISDILQFIMHYFFSARIISHGNHPVPFKTQAPYVLVFCTFCIIAFFCSDRYVCVRICLSFLLGLFELVKVYRRKSIF